MSLAHAIRLVEAKGYALHKDGGLRASTRRAIARVMQMPKTSSSTSAHVVTAYFEYVPRDRLRAWLVSLGWRV
eukprot:1754001-Pleurochrysis_carterae.AAC.2